MSGSDDQWHRESFASDRVVLDPYTSLEATFAGSGCFLAIGGGCLAIGAVAEQNWSYLLGTLGLFSAAGLALLFYNNLSDTLELDFADRRLSLLRHFGKKRLRARTTNFNELYAVVVNPSSAKSERNGPRTWRYGLAVISNEGKILALTRETQDCFSVASEAAERLANRMGCKHIEGKVEHHLSVQRGKPPEVVWSAPTT